jgi:hypothetical protein
LFTYGFLACCLSNILFAKKKHIKQSLEWYPLQGLVSLKECLSWWKKSKQQDSLFGSQNSAIVTKPTRRVPLKSHFFHSTQLGACTHSLIWPKQKPGWEKYMVLAVCIDQLVDLKTANRLPRHSAFLEVCTDFLRSFYTRLPKMRCVPVHRDTSQKFGKWQFC